MVVVVKGKQKAFAACLVIISALILAAGCSQQYGGGQPPASPPATNPPSGTGATIQASISNFTFTPSQLAVKAGDTVVWTNNDSAPHTVTSDSGSELDSQTLNNGGTYSHTFTQPGTYSYHCSVHPSMKATVVVQ